MFQRAKYPLRNELIWKQCDQIWKNEFVLLGQMNNMSTPKLAEFRYNLRQKNIFLRFPKPGILRAYLRSSGWSVLEPAVVGPTFCAVSNREPSELKEALKLMQAERSVILLGGKALDHTFTIEGINELVTKIPSLQVLQGELVGLLQSAGQGLVQGMQAAPTMLTSSLSAHVASMQPPP